MLRWVRNYSGYRELKQYAMNTYVLEDEEGYLQGEYRIDIHSWEEDLYRKDYKMAGPLSEHRYFFTVKDKAEANRIWKWIADNEPTYEQLRAAGFRHSTW